MQQFCLTDEMFYILVNETEIRGTLSHLVVFSDNALLSSMNKAEETILI